MRVLMTRQEIVPERLADTVAVVIDVFLATTTLLSILENGARQVFPVASVEEAEALGASLEVSLLLRGGEQDAEKIAGYELGPFPEEYPPEVVAGKDVIFVTTNGTKAIGAAAGASQLLVSCLRNAPATAGYLKEAAPESLYIVCAGSMGRFTLEDFLGASLILSFLEEAGALEGYRLNDGAWLALDFAKRYRGRTEEVLGQSRLGRWFFANDRMGTLRFVGEVGASDLVAEVGDGRLREVNGPRMEACKIAENGLTLDGEAAREEA